MCQKQYLCNLLRCGNRLGQALEIVAHGLHGDHQAAPDLHRVGAVGHVVEALRGDRPRQDGGGGGAVARLLVGLVGDILDKLGADVLKLVLQLDSLGDSDAVFGDFWAAPGRFNYNIPTLGAHCHLEVEYEEISKNN